MSSEAWPPAEGPDPLPRRWGLLTGVFVFVVGGGLLVAALTSNDATATVGSPAPDFTVELLDGGTFVLSDHVATDGRPVVINLWASWCPPCRAEIPEISKWASAHPDVYVLGVAVEDVEIQARAVASELSPSYDLGLGNDQFRTAYPSLGLPATYFLDERGRVTSVVNGVVNGKSLDEAVGR